MDVQMDQLQQQADTNMPSDNKEIPSELQQNIVKIKFNRQLEFRHNLSHSIRQFLPLLQSIDLHHPALQSRIQTLASSLDSQTQLTTNDKDTLLDILAELLFVPDLTYLVVRGFRGLIVELCSRWISKSLQCLELEISKSKNSTTKKIPSSPTSSSSKRDADGNYRESSVDSMDVDGASLDDEAYRVEISGFVFAKLLPIVPQIFSHAYRFLSSNATILNNSLKTTSTISQTRLLRIVTTIYKLMRHTKHNAPLFKSLFNFAPFTALLTHHDLYIRAYAAHVLALVSSMSDSQRREFFTTHLGDLKKSVLSTKEPTDRDQVEFLEVFEESEINTQRAFLYEQQSQSESNALDVIITAVDLCSWTVDVCGILLPKFPSTSPSKSLVSASSSTQLVYNDDLITTQTTARNIHSLAVAVSLGLPVLLEGGNGVGKTSLVTYLAKLCGVDEPLKIHLGDQTDSKLLLGTYTTPQPGQFVWTPGILTTAVMEGRWIIIEDLDLAPPEVLSTLIPLLETRYLFVPNRGERIRAKPGFMIFATRTIRHAAFTITEAGTSLKKKTSSNSSSTNSVGEGLWTKVHVHGLSYSEMIQVVQGKFSYLVSYAEMLVQTFKELAELVTVGESGARKLNMRDLMKWCYRLDYVLSQSTSPSTVLEDMFLEGLDVFIGHLSTRKKDLSGRIASKLGEKLQIPQHRVDFYLGNYVPQLTHDSSRIQIGRVQLSVLPSSSSSSSMSTISSKNFANTKLSLRLLEKIALSVHLSEPLLLVGETGTGKTTIVQHLATLMNQKLLVVNMSQQSDSSDLLGGFKPVDMMGLVRPVKEWFDELFGKTFSLKANQAFLDSVNKVFLRKKWKQLFVALWKAVEMADSVFVRLEKEKLDNEKSLQSTTSSSSSTSSSLPTAEGVTEPPRKKQKRVLDDTLRAEWESFKVTVKKIEYQQTQIANNLLFNFMEGALTKAVSQGYWILLDEINLATQETLETLSGLLQNAHSSLIVTERGDLEPIRRHPHFRLFACMNPGNDVGKRDLPSGFRSRFTEFWVPSPDGDRDDLSLIVYQYLRNHLPSMNHPLVSQVVQLYMDIKSAILFDGADQRPHFSIRTLSRALSYAVQVAPVYGIRRAIFEGFVMTFSTQLNRECSVKVEKMIMENVLAGLDNPFAFLKQIPKSPGDDYELFDTFWIERGGFENEVGDENVEGKYILTESVRKNLTNLARGVVSQKYPILIQGPTSAGKTSMIEYLAQRTGHRFVRINNHEHTDLQEYLGTYVSNSNGQLVFQEGVLVKALRKGYWIVLDELNLAPSDVLEALNRLLDDNRELLIPETQEVVKPHPHFMLFATQNPPGLYGGRKQLSRAFRNRFLELHFEEIPKNELEMILEQRCRIPPSYCKKLVQVYNELHARRQKSRIFEGKHGFITLRDLFRWAERRADSYQQLAEDGFMLLAERIRREDDKKIVKECLELVFKVKIDEEAVYNCHRIPEYGLLDQVIQATEDPATRKVLTGMVWTKAMKRLFTLVAKCLQHKEPILLVGETGCGKTTICQMLSILQSKTLHMVNCHQHTETSDFLGSQRPVRNKDEIMKRLRSLIMEALKTFGSDNDVAQTNDVKELLNRYDTLSSTMANSNNAEWERLQHEIYEYRAKSLALFEWHDGPLVHAMKNGDIFLLDEISLADDSVLERLNSVLEPKRLLVLAEKGGNQVEEIIGVEEFRFVATMNPGGDYGKKELSPALRNRFTEIWVPPVTDEADLTKIVESKLSSHIPKPTAIRLIKFVKWFGETVRRDGLPVCSLRDILSWVEFLNVSSKVVGVDLGFIHGGSMVFLDGLGINPMFGVIGNVPDSLRTACQTALCEGTSATDDHLYGSAIVSEDNNTRIGIKPFLIQRGPHTSKSVDFAFQAPTTVKNCMRVLRGLQLKKPILLEGSPGVGKTSLVTNLAEISGYRLVRINLSDQTDLNDLFGSDLPVEGGSGGEFMWRNGPFLQAMTDGHWVLLDELNLASQSVLEGLNACLDHRSTVYIPELDRSFECHPNFRVFAAQNPQNQGGGRKGLPKSFVNRFTQVYVDQLSFDDMVFICSSLHPTVDRDVLAKMIQFNCQVHEETTVKGSFGRKGAPWEFNLRDVFRWVELTKSSANSFGAFNPMDHLDAIYGQRMRTNEDREQVYQLYETVFGVTFPRDRKPTFHLSSQFVEVGLAKLSRKSQVAAETFIDGVAETLHSGLPLLESLMKCVGQGWMTILTGPEASGKTNLIKLLAHLTGNKLETFSMNNGVDTMELLGAFEQSDLTRRRHNILHGLVDLLSHTLKSSCLIGVDQEASSLVTGKVLDMLHLIENELMSESSRKVDMPQVCQLLDVLISSVEHVSVEEFGILRQQVVDYIQIEGSNLRGRFEWVDGVLIRALEQGHWILIDNANFCNPSVLDRLNPLLESKGVLMVNERGLVNGEIQIVKPHPNFRIFMTMDPKYGEISRAMRNRGIELSLTEAIWQDSLADMQKLFNRIGLVGDHFVNWFPELVTFALNHDENGIPTSSSPSSTANAYGHPRDLITSARLICERLERGIQLSDAVGTTVSDVYDVFENDDFALHENLAGKMMLPERVDGDSSSSNWPFDFSSAGIVFNSNIARVLMHATVVNSFLRKNHLEMSEKEKLKQATAAVIELCNSQDWAQRVSWLKMLLSKSQNSEAIVSTVLNTTLEVFADFLQSTLLAELEGLAREASLAMGVSETEICDMAWDPFVFESTLLATMSNRTDMLERYRVWVTKMKCYERVKEAEIVHQIAQQKCAGKKLSDLSVYQVSYLYHSQQITEAQVTSPFITYVYPLMMNLLKFIKGVIQTPSVETLEPAKELLKLNDVLWRVCTSTKPRFDELQVIIGKMSNVVNETGVLYSTPSRDACVATLVSVKEFLRVQNVDYFNQFWETAFIKTLQSDELFILERKFEMLGTKLDPCSVEEGADTWSKHLSACVDRNVIYDLADAIATLYYVDANNHAKDVESLTRVISELPAVIEKKIDALMPTPENGGAEDEVAMVHESLPAQIKTNPHITRVETWPLQDYRSMLMEMQLIQRLQTSLSLASVDIPVAELGKSINSFVDFVVHSTSRSALDIAPYQRLSWFLNAYQDDHRDTSVSSLMYEIRAALNECLLSHHKRLWNSTFNRYCTLSQEHRGSARLFDAVILHSFSELLTSWNSTPLHRLSEKKTQLQKLVAEIAMAQELSINMETAERQMIFFRASNFMEQIAAGTASSSDLAARFGNYAQVATTSKQFDNSEMDGLLEVVTPMIETSQHPAINSYFLRTLKSMQSLESTPSIGTTWSFLSLAFLSAYIPLVPVDPAVRTKLDVEIVQNELNEVEAEHWVKTRLQALMNGAKTSKNLAELYDKYCELKDVLSTHSAKLSLRPEVSQLEDLFADLHALRENLIVTNRVEELLDGDFGSDVSARLEKEAQIQVFIETFVAKLMSKYAYYKDILQPVYLALYELKHGLRIWVRHSQTIRGSDSVLEFVTLWNVSPSKVSKTMDESLSTRWPEVENFVLSSSMDLVQKTKTLFGFLQEEIKFISQKVSSHGRLHPREISSFTHICDRILDIWASVEERKKQQREEEEALYKFKERSHVMKTEEEFDLEELRSIFPDFDHDFADITQSMDDLNGNNVNASQSATKKPTKVELVISEEESFMLWKCYERYVDALKLSSRSTDSSTAATLTYSDADKNQVFFSGALLSMNLVRGLGSQLQHSVDTNSRSGLTFTASLAVQNLLSGADNNMATNMFGGMYDFYSDPNVAEASVGLSVLVSLSHRIDWLLSLWSDHEILLQISNFTHRIANFAVASPLMKFLTGFELLLQKCQEWETYADREHSIKRWIDDMMGIIVKWRRLELQSWRDLLHLEESRAERKASALWFHLLNLARPLVFVEGESSVAEFSAQDLIASLDQFLQTSPVAEFKTRLQMIRALCAHVMYRHSVEAKSSSSNVLLNVYEYYRQYETLVQDFIDVRRKPIEKELKEYVKIASWKEVNIYALRESVQKAHKKLHRLVRRYKDVLGTSCLSVFQGPAATSNSAKANPLHVPITKITAELRSDVTPWLTAIENSGAPSADASSMLALIKDTRLMNVGHLASRMKTLCGKDIFAPDLLNIVDGLEDLTATVLERIEQFRSQTFDFGETPEARRKVVRQHKVLRTKAFNDFLKKLQFIGCATRNTVAFAPLRQPEVVFSTGIIRVDNLEPYLENERVMSLSAMLNSGSEYYYRLLSRINKLRETASSGGIRDLTEAHVERATAAVEFLLSTSLKERAQLVGVLESYNELAGNVNHWKHVALNESKSSAGDVGIVGGAALCATLLDYLTSLDRICDGIDVCRRVFGSLKSVPFSSACLEKLLVLNDKCVRLRSQVVNVLGGRAGKVHDDGASKLFIVDEVEPLFVDMESLMTSAKAMMIEMSEMDENVAIFMEPLQSILQSVTLTSWIIVIEEAKKNSDAGTSVQDIVTKSNNLVDQLLIALQNVRKVRINEVTSLDQTLKISEELNGEDDDGDEFGLGYRCLQSTVKNLQQLTTSLNMTAISETLSSLEQLVASSCVSLPEIAQAFPFIARRLFPLLDQYCLATSRLVFEYGLFQKTLCKFGFILCNIFTNILREGFCLPQEAEQENNASEETMEGTTADNAGIGEGTGTKDVSNEIEDEDEALGYQGDQEEKKPEDQNKDKDEDQGMDMEQDFDGVLEDIDNMDIEDQDKDNEDDEEDKEKDADEQMGETNDQSEVVDEKLWGDEDDDNIDRSDEKVEDGSGVDNAGEQETETVAKNETQEDENDEDAKDKKKEEKKQKKEGEEEEEAKGEEKQENANEDGGNEEDNKESGDQVNEEDDQVEENHGIDVKPADNFNVDEGEEDVEDLPEDMNLDGDDDEEENGGRDDENGGVDEDEGGDLPEFGGENEDKLNEEGNEEDGKGDDGDAMEIDEMEKPARDEENEEGEENDEEGEKEKEEEEELEKEEGEDEENAVNTINEQSEQPNENPDETPESTDKTAQDQEPQQAPAQEKVYSAPNETANSSNEQQTDAQDDQTGGTAEGVEMGKDSDMNEDASNMQQNQPAASDNNQRPAPPQRKHDPNPHRSVGDALKQWMDRLRMLDRPDEQEENVDKSTEERADDEAPNANADKTYEHLQNEMDNADAQVLDVATADQVNQMDLSALDKEKEEEKGGEQDDAMEEDEDAVGPTDTGDNEDEADSNDRMKNNNEGKVNDGQVLMDETQLKTDDNSKEKKEDVDEGEGVEGAQVNGEQNLRTVSKAGEERKGEEDEDVNVDEDGEPTAMDEDEEEHEDEDAVYDRLRNELENDVVKWMQDKSMDEAHAIWKRIVSLTQPLAFELCEQLRLILEPTLATKLRGDYKSGKRLNMKKIIPYIASEFKKDKIWMRRTKPSKRQYQVMISVDDSKSMANPHTVELTYEALALISKALSQLEVGQIGVLSFGEDVRLLHPLDRAFSDEAGAQVIQKFTFDQTKTHVKKLMETSFATLTKARSLFAASNGTDDLWQLQIVLSDGICEDHQTVKNFVKRAAEKKIMVVFIIIDNKLEKDSILNMTNVSYVPSGPSGKMSLQLSKYMDTFPFDYFVVLRDIADLPDVMSDVLRQYFSFVGFLQG